jgi:hypothetical protein
MTSEDPAVRYAPYFVVFGGMMTALSHLAARREPRQRDALELAETMLATFFLTRVVAREKVGAPIREPFVEPMPGEDPADAKGDTKQAAGTGLRRTTGELLTCPRCLGPWTAAALTCGAVFAPKHARNVTRILALAGANSFLHAAHAAVCAAANRD